MYQSPISVYETAVQSIMEQRENALFAKIKDAFDVQVDKEELIRALQYDRGQYEKGYFDGKEEAMPKWIPVTELLPSSEGKYLCAWRYANEDETTMDVLSWDGTRFPWEDFCWKGQHIVTHWMPLLEPPKED